MRGLTKIGLGLVAAVAPLTAWAGYTWNFPMPVTPIAHETLKVHNLFMLIITVIFFAVLGIMLYSMWKHRKSTGHQAADFVAPKSKKQWAWVMFPFAILLIIDYVVFGIPAYHAILMYEDSKTDADMVVKVTGSQWLWEYEYPEEGIKFTSRLATPRTQITNTDPKGEHYLLEVDNPLILPVGKKIRFITTSNDVIHSWWVPAFGVKRDAVPGFLREFWATIDTPGIYRGQCAELCGKEHAFMPVVVHAVSEEDYRAWVASKKSGQAQMAVNTDQVWEMDDLMKTGADVYTKNCAACHQADGKGLPPAFPPIAGAAVTSAAFIDVEGRLMKRGHLDTVMNGRENTAMRSFKGELSDVEIAAVVTYQRNAFGNSAGDLVQPSVVKGLR